jgi:hypothetical protein
MESVGLFPGLVTAVILTVLGLVLIGVTGRHVDTVPIQRKLFIWAMIFRFVAALALYRFGLVNVIKDEDASGWVVGVSFAADWDRQGFGPTDVPVLFMQAFKAHHKGYYYLLGSFYFLTGLDSRLPAAALNCFFGAMTVVLAFRVAHSLVSQRAAVWCGWCVCLFPSLVAWSAQTVKEPVVILLETIALYCCVQLKRERFNLKYVVICVATIVMLTPFRFYAAYVAIVTVVLGLLMSGSRRPGQQAAGVLAAVGIAILLSMSSGLLEKEVTSQVLDLDYIEKFRRSVADGQHSGVTVDADLRTTGGMGTALAVGGAHLLFAPFPWQWRGLRVLLVVPEVLIWWWMVFAYVLPGLRHVIRRRAADFAPLLFFTLLMFVLYSLTFGNVGLVYRQRAQLLPWLFVFAAAGKELRWKAAASLPPERNGFATTEAEQMAPVGSAY